jgi:imidazoleglycerol-phosphate dehydratase
MPDRRASLRRETKETQVALDLNLDGTGATDVATGVGMLDHLVSQLGKHGLFDITLAVKGDTHIDAHHTTEDTGIVLGRAFAEALGDRAGITRMGHAIVPLDEALALVAVDLGGRGYAEIDLPFGGERIGQLPGSLVRHFLQSFAFEARASLHVKLLAGSDDHHRAEAAFKALARALEQACGLEPRRQGSVPSTKGVIG